ncbi:MAG: hypothetical protein ACJAT2_000570 [Bacteriovoracaceae bacterium]|jgi:hypothetical protein
MLSASISRQELFEGIVEASAWDNNSITELVFNTVEREVIPIFMDSMGESLIDYSCERLKLRGTIFGGYLHVTSFSFIKQ